MPNNYTERAAAVEYLADTLLVARERANHARCHHAAAELERLWQDVSALALQLRELSAQPSDATG